MSAGVPPPQQQWPLRPGARVPRPDLSEELLALERDPGSGKLTGLSVALANLLGIDVVLVRALFVITALSSGFGLMLYLAGWLLTRDARTGVAPLDRVGTNWHRYPGRVVIGWALALSALTSITFGSALGANWLSVVILVATIWLGWQTSRRPAATVGAPPVVVPQPQQPSQALEPGAHAVPRPRHNTIPMSVLVLCLAGLAAGVSLEDQRNLPLALAIALLVIGIGAVVIAWRGRSSLLVVSGLLVALGLVGAVFVQPLIDAEYRTISDQAQLTDLVVSNSDYIFDVSHVTLSDDLTWTVTVDSGSAGFIFAADQNIDIRIDHVDSWVVLDPDTFQTGTGNVDFRRVNTRDEPVLTVVIEANGSGVWVSS
ncbi:MAG: PspC domain-containing protein [Brooklawnia sp.]|uniref:PspC domain-containing protein n=1 Tax=Brooklawnia sp. TaxID=2699740 RepID=UPI003C73AD2A